jgi:hypothetical protein
MRASYFWMPVVAVTSFFVGTLVPAASTDTKAAKYFEVAYMKASPGKDADYLKIEQEMWKPLHQELIKQGMVRSWSLYGLQFPSGTAEKYDYVTVNAFDQFGQLENPYANFDKALTKVHPGVKVDDFIDRTEKARNLVRSEVWVLIDRAE